MNDFVLQRPQIILIGVAQEHTRGQNMGKSVTAGSLFVLLLQIFRNKTAFHSHALQNLVIITGNAQLFCNFLADGSAAAAKLTADSNNPMTHKGASFDM